MAIESSYDDKAVLEILGKIQEATGNIRPALDKIGRYLKTQTQLTFRASRDPWGKPWAPLVARQGKPLIDTRVLLDSIDYVTDEDSVTVGTNIEYAPPHQFGTNKAGPKKNTTIPARPYLPITGAGVDLPQEWADGVLGILTDHLESAING